MQRSIRNRRHLVRSTVRWSTLAIFVAATSVAALALVTTLVRLGVRALLWGSSGNTELALSLGMLAALAALPYLVARYRTGP